MVKIRNVTLANAEEAVMPMRGSENSFTFVIRDDTDFVTTPIKARLLRVLSKKPTLKSEYAMASNDETLDAAIDRIVDRAYQKWMRHALYMLGRHIDADKYDLNPQRRNELSVHLYDADELTNSVIKKAHSAQFVKADDPAPYLISLDDMIPVSDELGGEISFSRLFSLCGTDYFDYTARPGHPAIHRQLDKVKADLNARFEQSGKSTPIVLLEDNVRHARMLNWLENLMDGHGLFNHAHLAGISTCFCSADDAELSKIVHKGHLAVPVAVGVNYLGVNADVQTPRDLMFDGFVVKIDGQKGRLPGIFMDVASRFSVSEPRSEAFKEDIRCINREFCADIRKNLGVNMPLSWFVGAKPVSHVTNTHVNTSMLKVMR